MQLCYSRDTQVVNLCLRRRVTVVISDDSIECFVCRWSKYVIVVGDADVVSCATIVSL